MGSCVDRGSAKTAVSSISTMSAPPAAPTGFFRQNRTTVATRPGCPARAATTVSAPATLAAMSSLSRVPHARIQPPVEHVDEEIRQHDDDRDEHHQRLDDRIVAPQHRLHEEAREAGQVEDG